MNKSINKILIVDDEAFIRQSFYDFFEDRSWQPLEAESGEDALKIIEEKRPNCAVVDIRMGGMDGNSFIRNAHMQNPNLVFVICTGSPEYDVPKDLLKLSCVSSRLFKKPVKNIGEIEKELLRLIKIKLPFFG